MTTTDKQKEYVKKYQEKMDEIKIRPPKGTKDRWRAAAEERGMSLQQFVIETIDKRIESGK